MSESNNPEEDTSKRRQPEVGRLRIVSLLTQIIGSLGLLTVGAVGVFFSILEFRGKQPNVIIDVENVSLEVIPVSYEKIVESLKNIEDNFFISTGGVILDLIDSARLLSSETDIQLFNEYVDAAIQHFSKEGEEQIVNELRTVLEQSTPIKPTSRLVAVAFIGNRSQNSIVIKRKAIVRVWNDSEIYRDIDLHLSQVKDLHIAGNEIARATFQSRTSDDLDEEVQSFLKDQMRYNSYCLFLIRDMHDGVWTSNSRCSIDKGSITNSLRDEIGTVFSRITNR